MPDNYICDCDKQSEGNNRGWGAGAGGKTCPKAPDSAGFHQSSADQEVPKLGEWGGLEHRTPAQGAGHGTCKRRLGGVPGTPMPELSHQPCKPSLWEPAPKHSITMETTYPSGAH